MLSCHFPLCRLVNRKCEELLPPIWGRRWFFCGQSVSDLNPVISVFDVSCCYFETMDDNSVELETYIREVVVEWNVLINCMYTNIITYLLVFLSLCLFVWHAPYRQFPPCNYLSYGTTNFFVACCGLQLFLGYYRKTTCLTGNPPIILLLSKIDIVLTNQGEMEKRVVDVSNLDLDEFNIKWGYNTINKMDFSQAQLDQVVSWI